MIEAIGKYQLKKKLGQGSFGTTYCAFDSVIERDVALKLIEHAWFDEDAFRREVRPLTALKHPHIIGYIECNYVDRIVGARRWYIVTELANQGTLRDHILSILPQQALEYCRQLLSAIGECHADGILHSDLKPENIFLHDGLIKIGDFGLAHQTNATVRGGAGGTPLYMAPEQFLQDKTSKRTDLWSVGIVLYEMIFHRRPFHTIESIVDPRFTPPLDAVPGLPDFAGVITKALAKDEHQRYQSASEFLQAVTELQTRRINNIMNAEQGIVGWDWDGTGYDYREFEITFQHTFQTPPIIHTSIQMLDGWSQNDVTTRVWISAEEIGRDKAKIKVGT